MDEPFLTSECVSCGACVQACPTATLMEKSVVEMGQPEHSRRHHLRLLRRRLQLQGRDARRPGRAHGAVEGRQGQSRPFLRQGPLRLGLRQPSGPHPEADDPREDHRSVARSELGRGDRPRRLGVQAHPGQGTARTRSASSRRRAAPTRKPIWCRSWPAPRSATTTPIPARGSATRRPAMGWARPSAPRPARRTSTASTTSDVIMVIGANPTDGHPVFASRMKKRLRAGRQADRHRSAADRPGAHAACRGRLSPAAAARHQCRGADRAGACHRDRGAGRPGLRRASAATPRRSPTGPRSSPSRGNSPEATGSRSPAFRPPWCAARRGCYATGGNGAIYYGLGVTEHSQGSTAVMAIANLAMATGNIGRRGVGVNPLRGQNNVQGSCDMGSFPHELPGYRHVGRTRRARDLRSTNGACRSIPNPACASPTCWTPRSRARSSASTSRARTSRSPIPTPSTSPPAWRRWNASWCTICS